MANPKAENLTLFYRLNRWVNGRQSNYGTNDTLEALKVQINTWSKEMAIENEQKDVINLILDYLGLEVEEQPASFKLVKKGEK